VFPGLPLARVLEKRKFDLNVDELKQTAAAEPRHIDQLEPDGEFQSTPNSVDTCTSQPETRIYKTARSGSVILGPFRLSPPPQQRANEAVFSAGFIAAPAITLEGADIGILVTRGRFHDQEFMAETNAPRKWIHGIKISAVEGKTLACLPRHDPFPV